MSRPRISVVIVTYNSSEYVREAIESVLDQTLRPFEVIISDDCSRDGTWAIVLEYARRHPDLIKAHRQQQNIGIPGNVNSAFVKTQGDWVTSNAGDDRWDSRKLEIEWRTLQKHPEAQVVYSNVQTIDKDGRSTGFFHDNRLAPAPTGDVLVPVFSRRFFSNTRSLFRSVLLSRAAFCEVGGYDDEGLESYEDWDFKIRLAARFSMVYSGEVLVDYRKHSGGFHNSEPWKHLRAMIDVYEKNQHLLNSRSGVDIARVRCNIESRIALNQLRLPRSERNRHYLPRPVYDRNRNLLDQLPPDEREDIKTEVEESFALLAWSIAVEALKAGNMRLAAAYWRESLRYDWRKVNLKSVTRFMLPQRVFAQLISLYRSVKPA